MERSAEQSKGFLAWTAQHDVRDAVLLGERDQCLCDVFMFKRNHHPTHFLRRFKSVSDLTLHRCVNLYCRFIGCPDVNCIPLRIQLRGQTRRLSKQSARIRSPTADRHHDLTQTAYVAPEFGALTVPAIKNIRRLAQGHLPEPGQVLGREKVCQCGFNSFFGVDLAGLKPLEEIFRREVNVYDLVRLRDNLIGYALLNLNAGHVFDDVIERLEMLDVYGSNDVNPSAQQILHVFVALAIPALRGVCMCQFVDQRNRRLPCEDGVEIHLFQGDSMIPRHQRWNNLQFADLRSCLGAIVRFNITNHDIHTLSSEAVSFDQHLVGLADSRTRSEVDLQLAKLLPADDR